MSSHDERPPLDGHSLDWHADEALLHDFVDGQLSDQKRKRTEEHLRSCEDCSSTVTDLRALLRLARTLPPQEPGRDLLPGIRAATRARSARRAIRTLELAASFLLLASVAWWWVAGLDRRTGSEVEARVATVETGDDPEAAKLASSRMLPELREAERDFALAGAALLERLRERGDSLPPGTLETFESNLSALDDAIRDVRSTLESAEPGDAEQAGGHALAALHHKRMKLLWRASRLSS